MTSSAEIDAARDQWDAVVDDSFDAWWDRYHGPEWEAECAAADAGAYDDVALTGGSWTT